MTQKRLDDSNIGTALKQMGRKAVAQRVQRHALLDSGSLSRLMEQAAQLAGRQRLAGLTTRKQPAFLRGHSGIGARWSRLPPLAQQIEHLRRQHDIAVLAALCVGKIYVAMAAKRQSERTVPPVGGNITFAYESSERSYESDEPRIGMPRFRCHVIWQIA